MTECSYPRLVALAVGVLAAVVLAPLHASAAAADVSGTWEARAMGGRLVAHVEQNGNTIGGVAYVYHPHGKKVTYHFNGTVDGNRVTLAHHSGHMFNGHVNSKGQLVGVVTTKKGEQVSVTAQRR
ncbi:MAG: hypothetical protein FJY85_02320 [Deltaproteobacteria bacterium]|nr:hypothetical protein [Deltaproteobacteria bacterium]